MPTWINSNAAHNLLNITIAIVASMAAFDWTVIFTQATAATIVGILATVKVIVNVVRDGLAGLVKPQPAVGSTVVPPGPVVVDVPPSA